MKHLSAILFALLFTVNLFAQDPNIDQKVDSLLNLMTLDEKIGQMTQAERGMLEDINDISYYNLGSLLSGGGSSPSPNNAESWADMYDEYQSVALQTRLGIPLVYGVDAVHGHNNVIGAVIFPHNIGLGCTWNQDLVANVNQITAKEVAATGIDWTFSPCIAVPRNERWGRTYEGFGETAEIQKLMAEASVIGLQSDDLSNNETILACAKHFVGDGGTTNGTDQGNTQVSEEVLREVHMAGYIDAIDAGVGTVMASYNSWNGEKLHGHDYLLTDVLKNELGFEGFIISDWKGVDQVNEDYREAVKRSVNAGMDMVMVPDRYIYFISILKSLVEDGEVSTDRIDDAVRRILKQKFLLDLFNEPLTDRSLLASVGSEAHRSISRQAVRESIVLLNAKNDVLPLQKNDQKILVAGRLANDLGAQCGGWSISWQGSNGNITTGIDILEGIQNAVGSSEVIYSESGNYTEPVDVAVVVIGENPYAEGAGDRSSLNIEQEDVALIKELKEEGIPVIALLVSGRPMIIGELLPFTDAMIAAWLPGTEGDGIAEVLFGDFQPSGKLAHSWPKDMSQVPINFGDNNYSPLFDYKHGIQFFPDAATSTSLKPYAAISAGGGNAISLALTDKVTALNYELGDFEIRVNNVIIPDNISNISLSDFDESILMIELNTSLEPADENISISYSGNGIYASDLLLEIFDNFYVFNAVSSFGGTTEIPGRVQAEAYFEMYGIQTEACTDVGGGLNVGYIEPGDWMKYNIEVTQSGTYSLTSRISGYAPGTLLFTFNDTITAWVNYEATNGWQNWENFSSEVSLEAGSYVMKVTAQSDAFNINYYDFDLPEGITIQQSAIAEISCYPNPVNSDFQLHFSSSNNSNASIKLFNMAGILIQPLYEGNLNVGENTFNFTLEPGLPEGLYFIEIKDETQRYFQKLVKN